MQKRSLRTMQDLIEAAAHIFVRDGFQLARIDDVARLVGKSRGAVYAHFRDKEDLFFSVFENQLERTQAPATHPSLVSVSNREEELDIRPHRPTQGAQNSSEWLLYLELYLYARRTGHRSPRFSRILEQIWSRSPGAEFATIFDTLDKQPVATIRSRTVWYDGFAAQVGTEAGSHAG